MTFQELYEKILPILPGAVFEEDNEGQLVIYTSMTLKIYDGGEERLEVFQAD